MRILKCRENILKFYFILYSKFIVQGKRIFQNKILDTKKEMLTNNKFIFACFFSFNGIEKIDFCLLLCERVFYIFAFRKFVFIFLSRRLNEKQNSLPKLIVYEVRPTTNDIVE